MIDICIANESGWKHFFAFTVIVSIKCDTELARNKSNPTIVSHPIVYHTHHATHLEKKQWRYDETFPHKTMAHPFHANWNLLINEVDFWSQSDKYANSFGLLHQYKCVCCVCHSSRIQWNCLQSFIVWFPISEVLIYLEVKTSHTIHLYHVPIHLLHIICKYVI